MSNFGMANSKIPELKLSEYDHWSFMMKAHVRAQCGVDADQILEVGPIIPQTLDTSPVEDETATEGESEIDRQARELRNASRRREAATGRWRAKHDHEFAGDDRRRAGYDGIIYNVIINHVPRSLQSKLKIGRASCRERVLYTV